MPKYKGGRHYHGSGPSTAIKFPEDIHIEQQLYVPGPEVNEYSIPPKPPRPTLNKFPYYDQATLNQIKQSWAIHEHGESESWWQAAGGMMGYVGLIASRLNYGHNHRVLKSEEEGRPP